MLTTYRSTYNCEPVFSVLNFIQKQENQYTDNVTLRRVRETTVTVEKQSVLHILSVCL